jgi:hypothetical protein
MKDIVFGLVLALMANGAGYGLTCVVVWWYA